MKLLDLKTSLVFNEDSGEYKTQVSDTHRIVVETKNGTKFELVELADGTIKLTAITHMNSILLIVPESTTSVKLSQI